VDLEFGLAAIYECRNDDISLFYATNGSRQNVAGAQAAGVFRGEQKVAGANSYAQVRTDFGTDERGFQFHSCLGETAGHGATGFVQSLDSCVEGVFEP
jgi:hypothetical protein